MQEGGWKDPDIKQGRQQDNQIELTEDYLWQSLINLSNNQFAVVLTLWNLIELHKVICKFKERYH